MTGDLDMGTKAITNVGNIDGEDVSGLATTVGANTTAAAAAQTTADAAAVAALVDVSEQTLTDNTTPDDTDFEQWGTEEATITDPGAAVHITASLMGQVTKNATSAVAWVRVDISFDGGSTWQEGTEFEHGLSSGIPQAPVFIQEYHTGTPTGDIQARAMVKSDWTINDVHFENGTLRLLMLPV